MSLRQGLQGFFISALIVGFIVGLFRAENWKQIFTKFPAALGSYALVAFTYGITGIAVDTSSGDMGGMVYFVMPVVTGLGSPLLLVGEAMGWAIGRLTSA